MRVFRQSHGRVVGLWPGGERVRGWRKGGSVGSKRSAWAQKNESERMKRVERVRDLKMGKRVRPA